MYLCISYTLLERPQQQEFKELFVVLAIQSSHLWYKNIFPYFSAAFLTQTVCFDDTTVKFEIWDTAGQERYHSLAPMYYRGSQAAIVVYDITNPVSFKSRVRLKRSQISINFAWFLFLWFIPKSNRKKSQQNPSKLAKLNLQFGDCENNIAKINLL